MGSVMPAPLSGSLEDGDPPWNLPCCVLLSVRCSGACSFDIYSAARNLLQWGYENIFIKYTETDTNAPLMRTGALWEISHSVSYNSFNWQMARCVFSITVWRIFHHVAGMSMKHMLFNLFSLFLCQPTLHTDIFSIYVPAVWWQTAYLNL